MFLYMLGKAQSLPYNYYTGGDTVDPWFPLQYRKFAHRHFFAHRLFRSPTHDARRLRARKRRAKSMPPKYFLSYSLKNISQRHYAVGKKCYSGLKAVLASCELISRKMDQDDGSTRIGELLELHARGWRRGSQHHTRRSRTVLRALLSETHTLRIRCRTLPWPVCILKKRVYFGAHGCICVVNVRMATRFTAPHASK